MKSKVSSVLICFLLQYTVSVGIARAQDTLKNQPQGQKDAEEESRWRAVRGTDTLSLKEFLRQFPSGKHSRVADELLELNRREIRYPFKLFDLGESDRANQEGAFCTNQAPLLEKVSPHVYQMKNDRYEMQSEAEAKFCLWWALARFPIKQPFACTFNSIVKITSSRDQEEEILVRRKEFKPLVVVGVSKPIVIDSVIMPHAYEFGVVNSGVFVLAIRFDLEFGGGKASIANVVPGSNAGLQEVRFHIPDSVGGVSIGNKKENLFVSKGKLVGNTLFIESGFKINKSEHGKTKIESIKNKSVTLRQQAVKTNE
jgi:hypothetical protein